MNAFPLVFVCCGVIALSRAKDFPIYWHMPADTCKKFGFDYTSVKWQFTKNINNKFQGEKISIFYNAGSFPSITVDSNNNISSLRNGGLPQAGNITLHLLALKDEINKIIPDKNNNGLAVIDMEDWYPRWKLNSGPKNIYREQSRIFVRNKNSSFKSWEVESEAIESFHKGAEKFMVESIRAAKVQRPKASWGYYEYPYCDNYGLTSPDKMECSPDVRVENEKYLWLYKEMDVLYPYIYLYKNFNESLRIKYITGRLEETQRLLRLNNITRPVYPYASPRLFSSDDFLSKDDLISSLLIPKVCGNAGVILWGSSAWYNNQEKCAKFNNYLTNIMGPAVNFVAGSSISEAKAWLRKKGERTEICK